MLDRQRQRTQPFARAGLRTPSGVAAPRSGVFGSQGRAPRDKASRGLQARQAARGRAFGGKKPVARTPVHAARARRQQQVSQRVGNLRNKYGMKVGR